ncbi:MAG TPA: chorismate-binding protein [Bacteriovoracaceae bacterium]|nr:chorismate-binding protein [Bacteriovoracaceae bacterium]
MIFSSFKWNDTTTLELTNPSQAYVYYRSKRMNLLTGFPETYQLQTFLDELEKFKLQTKVKLPRVYHFHYELGLIFAGLGHSVGEDTPLAVVLEYKTSKKRAPRAPKLARFALKSLERPTWTEYKGAFNHIQEHLLDGNCYQVNLTYPFDFETEEMLDPHDIRDFLMTRPGLGAYAHASYYGEEMVVSNSPECLFQYNDGRLFTMPIKGTVKRQKNWKKQWKALLKDKKQEGELLMIVDLLRNDLNRLDRPVTKVHRLKAPLLAPGLLHQYSLMSVKIEKEVSILKTLEALFPGGSITGAPKKNVMQIIQAVERYQRGIYCGSTLLCYSDKKVASINIRTAQVSPGERLWRYGAGGGITLLSKPVEEYQEMEAKLNSFLTLVGAPGY